MTGPDLDKPTTFGKERLLARLFTKNAGVVAMHTFETRDAVVQKLFAGVRTIHIQGVDEVNQIVDVYFTNEDVQVYGLTIGPAGQRRVQPPGPVGIQ